MSSTAVEIIKGFSLTNRWLLYSSMLLTPAQFLSGIGNNCPSNIGFLAYNWYTQIQWYQATRNRQLHALSLLPVHLNFIFVFTYLGALSSGNIPMAIILGLATAGLIVLNTVTAWISWATNQVEGYGVYRFFFFGWRTLSPGWHKFILVWQIGDSINAFICLVAAVVIPIAIYLSARDNSAWYSQWWIRYPAIPLGAVLMLMFTFPLILWSELIVNRNHIVSETDYIAVWLFCAQVGAMMIPSCGIDMACWGRRTRSGSKSVGPQVSQV